jgi:hypothetical protein
MKKILLTTALGLIAASGFAQGTFTFANTATTLVTTNTSQGTGAANSAMASRVTLWYSSAASSPVAPSVGNNWDFTGWSQTTLTTPDAVGTPQAGRFSGGGQTTDTVPGGNSAWLFVSGWASPVGTVYTTFQEALNGGGLVGVSSIWSQVMGSPPPALPTVMATGAGGFTGLVLAPVPEPSTFVLAGLGAAALMIFRRRK